MGKCQQQVTGLRSQNRPRVDFWVPENRYPNARLFQLQSEGRLCGAPRIFYSCATVLLIYPLFDLLAYELRVSTVASSTAFLGRIVVEYIIRKAFLGRELI